MSKFWKGIVIIVAVIIVGAAYYGWSNSSAPDNAAAGETANWNTAGNLPANLANGGYYGQNGSIIAISSLVGMSIVDLAEDTPTPKEVEAGIAWDVNIAEHGIYYINVIEGSRIYRMDLDGSNKEAINDTHSRHLVVIDEHIYYADNRDENRLYRMNLDGTNVEQVMDNPVIWMVIEDDWIYYAHDMDNYYLYKYNLQTGEDVQLTEHAAWRIIPNDDYIYYVRGTEEGPIYRVPKYGGDSELIADVRTESFMVKDENVYFSTPDGLYRYDFHEKQTERISDMGYLSLYDAESMLVLMDTWAGEIYELDLATGQVENMF